MQITDTGPATRLRLPQSRAVARAVAALLAPPPAGLARRFSPPFLAVVLGCAALMMAWRDGRHPWLGLHDFYPLYYGAKSWLHSGNAYRLADVAPLVDHQHGIFLTGNAYPLPASLLALPLSLLSPHAAAVVWVGLMTAGVLLALRLYGASPWLILHWPLLEAIRLEQFTAFVVVAQIVALWAYRERRPWLLGLACALALTKPPQGLIFVAAMLLLTRDRLRPACAIAALWGATLLFQPDWPLAWLAGLAQYNAAAVHPYYWWLALLALPLLALRAYLGAAIAATFALFRFPLPSPYMASIVPLAVLDDRRAVWLVPASYLWWPLAASFGHAWGAVLAFFAPMLVLVALRWYEQRPARQAEPARPLPAT